MYLKSIELFGFKSFADRTIVQFTPGMTCIVGPNGCGKSNISDAVRWVLGERSAKMLRGRKMEDVIFAGTSLRKPLNMAEVSLTIDNRDKILSIHYDEVVLTRRLYRSGDAEYFINKTLCRFKDIQDLIMDTGIGSHSYSMIEQGRIDYILQADPDERRFLIEEAAGISRYKSQKDETIRKLERTENNLLRLADIVTEVERNIKYAERQAKRAERYREHFDKLKQKELTHGLYETSRLSERASLIKQDREQFNEKIKSAANRVQNLKAAVLSFDKEEEEKLQELRFKEGKRYEIKSEIQNRDNSKVFNSEKIGEIKNQIDTLEKELKSLSENKGHVIGSLEDCENELGNLQARKAEMEASSAPNRENADSLPGDLEALEAREKGYQDLSFERANQLSAMRNELHGLDIQENSLQIQGKKSRESYKASTEELERLQAALNQLESGQDQKQSALDTLQVEHSELLSQLETLENSIQSKRSEKETLFKKFQECASRLQILDELRSSFFKKEGITQETLQNLRGLDSVKAIYKEITIRAGYEEVVESVLGPILKALMLETPADIERLEEQLSDEDFARIQIFVKSHLSAAPPLSPSIAADELELIRFSEIVEAPADLTHLFQELFSQTFFIENKISNEAFFRLQTQHPALQLVHASGKIWGPGPRVTLRSNKSHRSFLLESGEQQELTVQRESKQSALENLTDEIRARETQLEEIRGTSNDKLDRLRSVQFELESNDRQTAELKAQVIKKEQESEYFRSEEIKYQATAASLKDKIYDRKSRLQQLEKEESDQKSSFEDLKRQISDRRGRVESYHQEKSQQDFERATLGEKLKYADDHIKTLKRQLKEEEERKGKHDETIKELRDKAQGIRSQNESLDTELANYRSQLQTDEIELHRLEEARIHIQSKKKEVSDNLAEEEKGLEENRATFHQAEMELKEIDHLITRETERLFQTYRIKLSDHSATAEELEGIDLPVLEGEISQLQEKVASAGTVNLLAVEEYEELKQRFDFLRAQKEDLDKARHELMEAIRKINRTTRKLFNETFEAVRQNFKEFFRILFEGGQAELVLIDEENPLDSGIDIFVRPPGKKTQNISLLSGGEKALTAIALLYSLFKIKPSPFSVLDEVDAPLDEANIDRFLEVLKKFTDNTQFIIITHNRKTIGMGGTIFGVTMQEAGVSKLVSVKLQEQEVEKETDSIAEKVLSSTLAMKEEIES